MAGTPAQPTVDIETLQATVTRLAETVGRLTTHAAGLMATEEGDYAGDPGPAVRAQLFEHSRDSDRRRMDDLYEQIAKLEVTMSEIKENHLTYQLGVDEVMGMVSKLDEQQKYQEKHMKSVKVELNASFHRASTSTDWKDKNMMITNIKGLDRLQTYQGDVSQCRDWRFNISTWLAQVNASFETLTTKLDNSTSGPRRTRRGQEYEGRTGRAHHGRRVVQ